MNTEESHYDMKNINKLVILVALLILILVLVVDFPAKVKKTLTLVDKNGTEISVDIDLTAHRHLILPDTLSGSLFLNGTEYKSLSDVGTIAYDMHFKDLFSEPMSRSFIFVRKDVDFADLHDDMIIMSTKSYDFSAIDIVCTSVSEGYATDGYWD